MVPRMRSGDGNAKVYLTGREAKELAELSSDRSLMISFKQLFHIFG